MITNTLSSYKKDKEFYIRLFVITLPIAMQSLITSSLNMLDTMMIGKIGTCISRHSKSILFLIFSSY